MNYACRYAIVRFMPYVETGEFANIGVVLMCPAANYFGFKLMGTGVSRITGFFDDLDVQVFRAARKAFQNELERIGDMVRRTFGRTDGQGSTLADFVFDEIARQREALIYADAPGVVITTDPEEKLQELFSHYVERIFATRQQQERVVEQRVRNILKSGDLASVYKARTLGNEIYKARFPFVRSDSRNRVDRAIKVLNLAHEDPARLYDHGWEWLGRVRKLRKENELPKQLLFALSGPKEDFGPRAAAFADVKAELENADLVVVRDNDQDAILEFAS